MSNETPNPSPDIRLPEWDGTLESPRSRAERRFFTAATGSRPTDEQLAAVVAVREAVLTLAVAIDVRLPAGRNKSLALTALEDVHMRANRGIFDPEAQR